MLFLAAAAMHSVASRSGALLLGGNSQAYVLRSRNSWARSASFLGRSSQAYKRGTKARCARQRKVEQQELCSKA